MNAPEREWSLTDGQKERLGEKLETEYRTLIDMLGENFHSTVIRMAVQIERIAMVLTAIKPIDQRTILLDALPDEYESKRLYSEAQSQGICVRTATRWNDYWQEHGFVQKIRHGYYKKVV